MSSLILAAVLLAFINKILFAIEQLLCRGVDLMYDMFEVFSGITTITYKGMPDYLPDFIFENDAISTIYIAMACIGFAMTFGFALAAVVRKMFDSTGEKVKATFGMILTNCFKACLLIMLMTAIVSATISATSVLLRQVAKIFDYTNSINSQEGIVFTDKQRAAMYRVLNTIGNYTINPSFENRYNINSCYNSVRDDLLLLESEGVFNFSYVAARSSWQYMILQLYNAHDANEELSLDVFDESITDVIVEISNRIKLDADFKPLEEYARKDDENFGRKSTIGRTIMMSGSLRSGGKNPSLTDSRRAPFYYGDKDAYDYDEMDDVFDIGLKTWDHLLIIFVAYIMIMELGKLLINVIARIYNIILLYVTAPGFISVMPLDDGGKFKQWTIAFTIQSLSIFGSFIAVRLLVMFMPIIMDTNLVLFNHSLGNYLAKLIILISMCMTAQKASGMISGILADNAGYQSIMAGDVGGGVMDRAASIGTGLAKAGAKLGWNLGKKTIGGVGSFVSDATGLTTAKDNFMKKSGLSKLKNLGQSMRDKGGLKNALQSGLATNKGDKAKAANYKSIAESLMNSEMGGQILGAAAEKLGVGADMLKDGLSQVAGNLGGEGGGKGGKGGGLGSLFGNGGNNGGNGGNGDKDKDSKEPPTFGEIKDQFLSDVGKAVQGENVSMSNDQIPQNKNNQNDEDGEGDGFNGDNGNVNADGSLSFLDDVE